MKTKYYGFCCISNIHKCFLASLFLDLESLLLSRAKHQNYLISQRTIVEFCPQKFQAFPNSAYDKLKESITLLGNIHGIRHDDVETNSIVSDVSSGTSNFYIVVESTSEGLQIVLITSIEKNVLIDEI